MCGIFAYAGSDSCTEVILNGLKSLEYRGYDSWGIALKTKSGIELKKEIGKVSDIGEFKSVKASAGIGHTRWATHGNVSVENSHPHTDSDKRIYVVHNGIIENFDELKDHLRDDQFYSKTDTEIIPKLIAGYLPEISFPEAVKKVVALLKGNFAFVAIDRESDYLIAARNGSPIVAALKEGNFYISSDLQSLVPFSESAFLMNDGEMVIFNPVRNSLEFYDFFHRKTIRKEASAYDIQVSDGDRGNYKHFMLKEIFEQPRRLQNTFDANVNDFEIRFMEALDGEMFVDIRRIVIIACGTSWHAGLVAEYWLESLVEIPVEVEYASEFRYRNPVLSEDTLGICFGIPVPQSGAVGGYPNCRDQPERRNGGYDCRY